MCAMGLVWSVSGGMGAMPIAWADKKKETTFMAVIDTEKTKAYWTQMIEDYRKSGLTQKEFSAERKISYYSLNKWIYLLKKGVKKKTKRVSIAKPKRAAKPSPASVSEPGCRDASAKANAMLTAWFDAQKICERQTCVDCDNVRRGARMLLAAVL